ncbi:GTP cyclohydrolase I FolE2 [Stutzerimonas stutzeri]|uniref:GTP cyclohydrolase FolE2 n=1 Tax=Stutzerimonas stutzeri TaxID=316 RepID=A0A2S4ATU6_STUST|nr:GTP cyclohydrolase FolE2 [Stutzerimonas stutzeri]MCQ4261550.1 GTP cyclohydrolase FolE2 [Stutzerimonas stutzeri]POH84848.1 GTP cyclohydrolase I FolE2 [Stutzerimonas stutzeri]
MSILLPDVAMTERSATHASLEWVGMAAIDLPIMLDEPGVSYPLNAQADVQVNLPDPTIKGIHMSRLYRLLDDFAARERLNPSALAGLLERMVGSHADCHSSRARLGLTFSLLCRRPALLTEGLSGWKSYPVVVNAVWAAQQLSLEVSVQVAYSSTCPCSAALTRQLIEQAFLDSFGCEATVTPAEVAAWLQRNATLATPHSQRSVAEVRVRIAGDVERLDLLRLIDRIEAALGTPVQTAVKRADEQAFARLNGQNLMYVEDAARRIEKAVAEDYPHHSVSVRHLESLHPHDAVASSSSMPVS